MFNLIKLSAQFRIRTKMWFGFGLLMFFLVVISSATLISMSSINSSVNNVVNISQPMVIASMELVDALDQANAALGFYLLSQDKNEKQIYLKSLKKLKQLLATIKGLPATKANSKIQKSISEIEKNIKVYSLYKKEMLILAVDFNKNFKGIGLSAEKMNPLAREIQQSFF